MKGRILADCSLYAKGSAWRGKQREGPGHLSLISDRGDEGERVREDEECKDFSQRTSVEGSMGETDIFLRIKKKTCNSCRRERLTSVDWQTKFVK